jgi:uncharacterized protein (DUF1697 family)
MKRYVALLRGVFTATAKMADLRRAFERAGFDDVTTVLASGNVLFSTKATPIATLERRVEAATKEHLGSAIPAFVRPVDTLRRLVAEEPFARFRLARGSKRIVSFLHAKPKQRLAFPIVREKARILGACGTTVYSAYVRQPGRPVFMALLADTFGDAITTRTWETITKVAR